MDLIKSMYKYTKCSVKINGKLTNPINYERGVLQGNPLSPLLFNLYIDDIVTQLKSTRDITLDENNKFNVLMYADDLIVFANSKEKLQQNLDIINKYCEDWKLEINCKKTKCMTFTKGTHTQEKFSFKINGHPIDNVKQYKYLGITINAKNCSFLPSLTDLSSKATNALYLLRSRLPLKLLPVKTSLKIFDACISPILEYASEVWCPYLNYDLKKWDTTPIERVHTQFLKRMIGVNYSTTNILVRKECGRNPLLQKIFNRNINYVRYVKSKDNDTLVKQAFQYEILRQNDAQSTFTNMIKQFGPRTTEFLNGDNILNAPKHKLKKAIYQSFNQLWFERSIEYAKAETYLTFKTKVGLEKYLEDIKDRKLRVAFSKFRLSDHNLKIEEGRRSNPKIDRDKRFCAVCMDVVEDEVHFLIKCPSKNSERDALFSKITQKVPIFETLHAAAKFIYMLSQEDKYITKLIIEHIKKWCSSPTRTLF